MTTKPNFYTLSNLPKCEVSPTGKDVYEWEYLDKVGNLKKDKKDLYQSIQSFKNQTDYKKRIEQGETFENGNGIYLDTRKFDGDYGDINEYLASLASMLRSQVAANKNNGTAGASETVEKAGETPKVNEESASDTSASGTTDNGKGDNGK